MITKTDLKNAADAAASEELHVLSTIKALREGEFIDELNDALQKAIDSSTEHGKPAKLTITLDITPAGRTVVIDDKIVCKTPEPMKDATIFFIAEGNTLSRKDPKQTVFPVEAGFAGKAAANGG